jgi:hypothetical protein
VTGRTHDGDWLTLGGGFASRSGCGGGLQLYGRGLAHAAGLPVRERLVVFTARGRAVPV